MDRITGFYKIIQNKIKALKDKTHIPDAPVELLVQIKQREDKNIRLVHLVNEMSKRHSRFRKKNAKTNSTLY